MKKQLLYWISGVVIVGGVLLLPKRGPSQSVSGSGDLSVKSTERTVDANGNVLMIEERNEVIRPDGSRAITKVRTHPSKSSPSGWEAQQIRTVYLASENTTYDIFPALKMFGKTPIGREHYHALTPMSDCRSTFATKLSRVVEHGRTTKFSRTVVTQTVTTDDPASQSEVVLDVDQYPELACLVGDSTSQIRDKATNALLSRKVVNILSMDSVPDEPSLFVGAPDGFTEGKPSEILRKDAEVMGRGKCPTCATKAEVELDLRHDELWAERNAGKR